MSHAKMEPNGLAMTRLANDDLLSDVLGVLKVESSALYVFDVDKSWAAEWRPLPFYSSWTIMEGTVWISSPDAEPLTLQRGDTVLLRPGASRQTYVFGGSPEVGVIEADEWWRRAALQEFEFAEASRRTLRLRWGGEEGLGATVASTAFHFNDRQLGPLLAALPELMIVRASDAGGEGRLIDNLLRFAVDGEETDWAGFSAIALQAAQLLLLVVIRTCALSIGQSAPGLLSGLCDPQIGRALKRIHDDPDGGWTVAALAREAGLSRSMFAERFVILVGQTPIQYLRALRMYSARDALVAGKMKVKTLAHEMGYRSEAAFRTAFRKVVGTNPRELQRASRDRTIGRSEAALSEGPACEPA